MWTKKKSLDSKKKKRLHLRHYLHMYAWWLCFRKRLHRKKPYSVGNELHQFQQANIWHFSHQSNRFDFLWNSHKIVFAWLFSGSFFLHVYVKWFYTMQMNGFNVMYIIIYGLCKEKNNSVYLIVCIILRVPRWLQNQRIKIGTKNIVILMNVVSVHFRGLL